jgi:hypothetical protein
MKNASSALALLAALSFSSAAEAREAAAVIQMTNYEGRAAYLAVYLVNSQGRYETTLWVSGKDRTYYTYLDRWWRYLSRAPQVLDAVTGASAGAGDRVSMKFDLKDDWLDKGYAIRIESSVEGLHTNAQDAVYELKAENSGARIEGTGYVRNLRVRW